MLTCFHSGIMYDITCNHTFYFIQFNQNAVCNSSLLA
nr:MAG TPA: hypothetical protein [Caudoviricetes sp.]